jgi:hypothetical protein
MGDFSSVSKILIKLGSEFYTVMYLNQYVEVEL